MTDTSRRTALAQRILAVLPQTQCTRCGYADCAAYAQAIAQGECGINPIAPAVSNALANATGVRFAHLPFTPDRLYARLSSMS